MMRVFVPVLLLAALLALGVSWAVGPASDGNGITMESAGYIMVAALALTWLEWSAYWKLGKVEELWANPDGDSASTMKTVS
ncbi:hypothetical protein AL755_08075 [Arthrobacter sp. ERGS1:01]|nr:hypothetical protein AL755_08075 [Arthrobacter sp. ERGS1:01]